MGQQRIRMGLFGAALVLGIVVLLVALRPRLGPLRVAMSALQIRPTAAAAGSPAGSSAIRLAGAESPSQLADGLNLPNGDVHSDLRLVDQIFIAYRNAIRGGNPVGENSEITAALTGRNKLGFAFIPPDSPAINSKGELCDRWGTPYFFHQLSGEKMEVRSAGPDHKLWTDDDEVFTP